MQMTQIKIDLDLRHLFLSAAKFLLAILPRLRAGGSDPLSVVIFAF